MAQKNLPKEKFEQELSDRKIADRKKQRITLSKGGCWGSPVPGKRRLLEKLWRKPISAKARFSVKNALNLQTKNCRRKQEEEFFRVKRLLNILFSRLHFSVDDSFCLTVFPSKSFLSRLRELLFGGVFTTVFGMERDIERVQEAYAAFNKGDLDALLEVMAPDLIIEQSAELPWGGTYEGHSGAREFLAKLKQHIDSRVEIERFIDAGDHVIAVGHTTGKARATKLEFDVPLVHVWKVWEGQIAGLRTYLDNATMLAALNL